MLKTLLEKRAAALARCEDLQALAETRELTDVERTEFRSKLDEAKNLLGEIRAAEELIAARTEQEAAETRAAASTETRADQLVRRPGAAATVHDNTEDKPFLNLAEQLISIRDASTSRGLNFDSRLRRFDLSDLKVRAAAGLNEGVGSEAGFLVGTDQGSMIEKTAFDTGLLASKVEQIPLSANSNGIKMPYIDETSRATGSRYGGIRTYWLAEAASLTASKPAFGKFELGLNKLGALVYLTDEVMQDASATGAIVNKAVSEEISFALDDAIVRGSGAGAPLGVLNSPCLVSVAKETSQTAATIVYENISKMRVRMTPRMYSNAFWYINSEALPQLEQLQIKIRNAANTDNVGGFPIYVPQGGASATPFGALLGRPVIPIEQCEALGTVGDIMLLNLGYYMMSTKGGVQTASSIHVNFLTDEQVFRFILRTDGRTALRSAITPYKGSATLSPYVVLATRS